MREKGGVAELKENTGDTEKAGMTMLVSCLRIQAHLHVHVCIIFGIEPYLRKSCFNYKI